MIKFNNSVCIEATAEAVWTRMAKLEDIQLWSDEVLHARCEGALTHGVGAERTCVIVGNRTIKERWVGWDEGRSFQYEGFGIPLVKHATNRWTVIPYGEDKSLLTSEAEIVIKGGQIGRILEPLMRPIMQRMAPNALAAFKYLVENGKPYSGKASELPRPPELC